MSKIPFLLLFAVMITACGTPQSSKETTETVADTTQTTVKVATDADAEEASPAYVTTVLQADLPSPRKQMVSTLNGTTITINYGSPSVKGRELWGALVPYDEVWRMGANEATSFTADQDLQIGGKTLPAGTYGLFAIPTAKAWTLIFNTTADQWGAYEYDQSKDVLRVMTTPRMGNSQTETMEFIVEDDTLMLVWGKLRLPFPLG